MARTLNAAAHAAKRDSILDAVEQLIASKGYENLTILDLVAAVGMSKGAFYHYYPSKADVLEALLERRLDQWQALILPIAESDASATDRLRSILQAIGVAKWRDRDFVVESLRGLYADENALVHRRTRVGAATRFTPLIATVIEAGVQTGEFRADAAASSARVVVSLLQECADSIGMMLLAMAEGQASRETLTSTTRAYVDAIHATLGAAPGTIDFIGDTDLASWATAARPSKENST